MNWMLKVITLLVASLFIAEAHAQDVYNIRVIDARNFKEPRENWKNPNDVATYKADMARHKHHEVNVLRKPSGYLVNYYQLENDIIIPHGFYINEHGDYDRVAYSWSKDTVVVHLFNATEKTKVYKGFGWGGTSSLKLD